MNNQQPHARPRCVAAVEDYSHQQPSLEAVRTMNDSFAQRIVELSEELSAAQARVAELEQRSAGAWTVDHSCGRPILMYEGCSVIEDIVAYEVLRLIKDRDAGPAA